MTTTTITVSPTAKKPTHHISLTDPAGTTIGLVVPPDGKSIQRRPRQISTATPFTQKDWGGGRGLKYAEEDSSRYGDSGRANGRHIGHLMLGGQETYCNGHRTMYQYMPGSVAWQSLLSTTRYIAFKLTAATGHNMASISLWLRRRGTPTSSLTARLMQDNTGSPGTVLKSVAITTANVTDTISQLYEFIFSSVQAMSTADYWVEVEAAGGADDAANHWEIATDVARGQAKTKISAAGTDWADGAFDLYFQMRDDYTSQGAQFFMYKGQLYMVTRCGTPKLYMNGYRGVATGAGQTTTKLVDTTQSFPVDGLIGSMLLLIDGTGAEQKVAYRVISDNDATSISWVSAMSVAPVAASSCFVVLASNTWTEIAGHGLTVAPTDVCVAGGIVYFACGDFVQMRKMIERVINAVWTRTFLEENNRAKLLMTYRHQTKGEMLVKANDYDNVGQPSVCQSATTPFKQRRLNFPFLLTDCETATGWTAGSGTTLTLDPTEFMTGSGSIKMVRASGDTLCGYVTFAAKQPLNQKRNLRLWVYSSLDIEDGELKIRLSKATDCSTSIQDISLGAMEGGTWNHVVVAYKDEALNINLIRSVGFILTIVASIWVDGIEALPGESEVKLGSDLERIQGLELYGDPAVPWVFRTASCGSIENGIFQPIPLREFSQVASEHNGVGHVVHDIYLYFSFLHGIERYYRSNLDDVGLDLDEGLPAGRQGFCNNMVGYVGRLFASYNGGADNRSCIYEGTGKEWHELYHADTVGKQITDIFVQTIPGDVVDRLWFAMGGDVAWLPLPGATRKETTDSAMRFTHEAWVESGWIVGPDPDLQKLYARLMLNSETLSASVKVEWDYKLDSSSSWTPIATSFTSWPFQEISLNQTGYRMKLRLRLQTNDYTKTPVVTGMIVDAFTRPRTRYTFTFPFLCQDAAKNLLGEDDTYNTADALLDQLDTWMLANTPLTMHSTSAQFDNKTVYVEPVVENPGATFAVNDMEKYAPTLTLVEP